MEYIQSSLYKRRTALADPHRLIQFLRRNQPRVLHLAAAINQAHKTNSTRKSIHTYSAQRDADEARLKRSACVHYKSEGTALSRFVVRPDIAWPRDVRRGALSPGRTP